MTGKRAPGRRPFTLFLVWTLLLSALAAGSLLAAPEMLGRAKKVVFIAGKKSHGPGDHEYERGLKLLARSLEASPNARGFQTEVHLNGWPEDPRTLDDADTIVVFSDGSDHNEADHPLLQGDRLRVLERAMKRGAGLVLLHYTVFAPVKRGGPEYLDWVGGFFDYESGTGKPPWYSKIRHATTTAVPATPAHPVSRGLSPFPLREEYYYNMRFRENDSRRVPLLTTEIPGENGPQTVAWAVQRADGGRGFAYTGGHFHSNWEVEGLRKLVLNAIVWTAKGEVPAAGVQSTVAEEDRAIHALVVTGHHHPAHDWRATTAALRDVLSRDPRFIISTIEDPERLAKEDLSRYGLLILNYCNWERPTLGTEAREKLLSAVRGGKGLVLVHFANGAWLDWPEYRRLSRRVWIEGTSSHDAHGPFRVQVRKRDHFITSGLEDWDTVDELYCRQQGELPIDPLVTARSKVSGQDEPLAYVYQEGQGRIFQCLLGHDARAIRTPGTAALYRRGAAWVASRGEVELRPEQPADRTVEGRFGRALNPEGTVVSAPHRPEYDSRELTVECWAKLRGKSGFNILVASSPKESSTHWELYTTNGTGTLAAYLPGLDRPVFDSGAAVADDRWHYLAMTVAPAETAGSRRVRLYVDGRQVLDQSSPEKPGKAIPGPLWFGAYPPQGIGCDGWLDEVRVSNSAREIAVPSGPLPVDRSTVGLWRFDAEESGRFADLAPLNNAAQDENPFVAAPETSTQAVDLPVVRAKDSLDWPNVGNDKGGARYSPLTQINRENVGKLRVAWTYRTGDANPAGNSTIECTPVVVEGVMYVTTARVKIAALDAATGRELWKHDPKTGGVNRGVAYWSDGRPNGERRILAGLADGRLLSLDARTGRPDPAFASGGTLHLRDGIEQDISRVAYGVTSAPAVVGDVVVLGFLVSESQPGAPGDVRAFDVRTGREVWRFHTVPKPYEVGSETWEGDSWKNRSGANAWGGFTVDAKNGIVFCATGSAASDFYGGDRKGANLFANCVLALDAKTGKRLWHFQTVHHDLWDLDNPCPPVVCTVRQNGKQVEAVAQVTKTGYCYVLDRRTGRPLFPVEEVPVPASDVPGEQAYPTQPRPVRPPAFSRQAFTDAEVTDLSPESRAYVAEKLKGLRRGEPFTPPSERGSVNMPGFHGGANWSGASFDPTTGWLYVNSCNVPWISQLKKSPSGDYIFAGYTYFTDQNGYPAIKPPWGQLNAIDLSRGELAWQVTLGEYPELREKGIPPTGTENFGGTIITAGGLVFIGGTKDEKLHAFDKKSGKLLWEWKLPAGGYATPCTYMVNGRQYVCIAAGGGGKQRTRSGDQFVTFALPAVSNGSGKK